MEAVTSSLKDQIFAVQKKARASELKDAIQSMHFDEKSALDQIRSLLKTRHYDSVATWLVRAERARALHEEFKRELQELRREG